MVTTGVVYLVDKSALARMPHPAVHQALQPLMLDKALAVCEVTQLEVLYSARDQQGYERDAHYLRESFRLLSITHKEVGPRVLEMQAMLAGRPHHRAVGPGDLLIAACAEAHQATILHYDRDFDVISQVTGQPALWVVPPGSVP
ncbi:PIN domain nuclease [Nonomuraea spiralis]|uniref:Ribonuclease VapC n=1 Tax=Nonomuraea spiralis TaxID=46182 RepID=A0ABV5IR02_9ACTN|nr:MULTISPECIES: PIN domain nuclease [Nonomuraea]RSN00297.1 VapC toxin family PIN domain ribonuclease [Nonomuraea sp. WAC 01424]GGT24036.1 ribonuclease VapC21 [Nonomuraea spiralis]